MPSGGWALIPYDGCPGAKMRLGQTCTQGEPCEDTGRRCHQQAREASEETSPAGPLVQDFPPPGLGGNPCLRCAPPGLRAVSGCLSSECRRRVQESSPLRWSGCTNSCGLGQGWGWGSDSQASPLVLRLLRGVKAKGGRRVLTRLLRRPPRSGRCPLPTKPATSLTSCLLLGTGCRREKGILTLTVWIFSSINDSLFFF